MTSYALMAVAAPQTQIEVNPAPQPIEAATSPANYLGGAIIFVALAVMLVSGFSAAGILRLRRSPKSTTTNTPRIVH